MSCETTFNIYQQSNPVKKCGSVTAKRAYLFQTKELIRQALNAKGLDVTTDDTFRSYAEYIMQLPNLNNTVTAIIDAEGEKHVGDVTIDKAFIGLNKVDNTTDLEKPISNATQAALDLKANKDASGIVTNNWRAQLHINNVDNTSDADKPISTATQAALDKKQDKLLYYTEVSGAEPSAAISVKNIKLEGSVAEGSTTTASGYQSHAEGIYTKASSSYQHAQGKYNIEDTSNKYADIIGNGTSNDARSNAATVSWEGISWSQTDVRAGGADQGAATHSLSAKQNATDNNLTTTAKTVVGGINEVKAATTKNAGDITANAAAIASKQDSTINLEIQGATAATVSDALTSLDTALTSVKSTADNAAKKDASNIEATTWKTVLGYQNADEVATAVNNGITTNEYSTLATTAKTVKGAIEELKTGVDSKASSSDFTALQGKVTTLETTVGDAEAGLVKDVADNTAAINAANINIAKKQNAAISIEGIEAKTVEGALTEIKNATTTNATAISGKADKATTLAGYNIGDAYTKTEVNTELGSKQDKLTYYTENTATNKASFNIDGKSTGTSEFSINVTDSVGDNSGNSVINLIARNVSNGAGEINLEASGSSGGKILLLTYDASVDNSGIELNAPFYSNNESSIGNNSGILFNGPISGTGITKTITDVDYRLPTSKAVKTELDKKQDSLHTYTETETGSTGTYGVTIAGSFIDLKINEDANGIIYINGPLEGSAISTSIPASESASDTKVPSVKAVATAVAGINTAISGKADKATTLAGYNISDAYTKTETGEQITSAINTAKSELQTTIDGKVSKTDITTTIAASSAASDTKVPSEKAVATSIEGKANKATTLSGYGITDAKIESGVITLGNNTITPLTSTSSIPANLIAGTVDSSDKAINDADGNPISTTYAKFTDVNADLALKQNITDDTLATTAKTVPAAINEVNSALSSKQDVSNLVTAFSTTPNDTKYPSEKLVYSSLGTLSQSITSLENDTQALSNNKANKATTLAGYNIGDAYTKDNVDTKLNLKQDKTDNNLNTTSKTIVGGINELAANKQNNLATYTESETSATITSGSIILNGALSGSGISSTISGNADSDKSKVPTVAAVYDSIQSLKVTSTVNTTVTPKSIKTATAITNALAKSARVVVNPNIANTGAVYIQESDTYTSINPIYPDPTNNVYEFVNMQNVKVFIDSLGDSVDLRIEYRG